MLEYKPDYEMTQKRIDAWWHREVVDRALTFIYMGKPNGLKRPLPVSRHPSVRERKFDAGFRAEEALANVANTICYADALPVMMPDLGPDWFASLYGGIIEYNEESSWSVPILEDCTLENLSRLRLDMNGIYFKKMMELMDAYIAVARGKCLVGNPDFHVGGDFLESLCGSAALSIGLMEEPDAIKKTMNRITDDFFKVYDNCNRKLLSAGMPSASWLYLPVVNGRFHVAQNDFSCMVSPAMFKEFFAPVLAKECGYMDRVIYHLDGMRVLHQLDNLLEIPNLHAIQYVPGPGGNQNIRWLPVWKKIQDAGKCIFLYLDPYDLMENEFFEILRPEGICIYLGISSGKEYYAENILKKIARWK